MTQKQIKKEIAHCKKMILELSGLYINSKISGRFLFSHIHSWRTKYLELHKKLKK